MQRYRFGEFVLSPRRRLLVRNGREQPLIPRYFDLLVFLVERRGDAVNRREIFDRVWSDVVVSDGALSQAIRTIRRVLDDDSREPRFVRTVSRHGYQFVFVGVTEEEDNGGWPDRTAPVPMEAASADLYGPLIQQITHVPASRTEEEEQREAAERLHALGTAEVLRRLAGGHPFARALLRDTRWDTAEAGRVPIFGQPDAISVAWHLARLRLRRGVGIAAARWTTTSIGGGVAGMVGGALGGLLLAVAPGSVAPAAVVPVLAVIGAGCGSFAAAGVGAGLSIAESLVRSRRTLALIAGGAVGGGLVGLLVQFIGRWTLAVLVGVDAPVKGGLEGLVIGGGTGLGFAVATAHVNGGLAAPQGLSRLRAAMMTAAACGVAALGLSMAGRSLVGGTIHAITQASSGGQAVLTPLGRLLGEPGFGDVTAALISTGEGVFFGLGLALGLTYRRRISPKSQNPLTSS
jgi:DNA-binding winged helix-turn-helix (wHTH) protein